MSSSFNVSWVGGDYQRQDSSKEEEFIDIREEEFVLEVPFEEKEDAKSFGCKWNKDLKKWFVPKGVDVNKFKKWHPQSSSSSVSLSKEREVERREEPSNKGTTKTIDMNMGFSSSDEDEDDGKNERRKDSNGSSPAPSALTEEQMLKIEQNRLLAMEKRRLKLLKEEQSQQEQLSTDDNPQKVHVTASVSSHHEEKVKDSEDIMMAAEGQDVCITCNERPADIVFKDAFDVLVCNMCKAKYDEFKLHNKVEIKEIYLLTDSTIRLMRCLTKDNPHNPHWAQMKLYLAKHGKEKSMERWGSDTALEEERSKRRKEQYNKDLEKASKVLLTSTVSTAGTDIDEVDDGATSHLSKMLQMMKDDSSSNELNTAHSGEGLSERIMETCNSQNGEESVELDSKKKGDRRKKGPTGTQSDPKKAKRVNRMAAIMTGNY